MILIFSKGRYIKQLMCKMSFDTSWNIDQHRNIYEGIDLWQFRQAFLIANKYKYPRERLVVLSEIFMNIEFKGCRYPKPTMDLIENLSKGFFDNLKRLLDIKVEKFKVTTYNAVGAKDNENAPSSSKLRYLTPFDSTCILPGFMLRTGKGRTPYDIVEQSCSFSGIAKPEIFVTCFNDRHVRATFSIKKKLITIFDSHSEESAIEHVSCIAYGILKEMCFTIEVKEIDKQSQISWSDIVNDSIINTFNCTTDYNKILDNNVGYMILKNMGWKVGDSLGKNIQQIASPIEIIYLKKRVGLGFTNCENKRTDLNDFKLQFKKYIMKFLDGPKKRISFSIEFTKEERDVIDLICTNVGLRTKSHEKQENKQFVIFKNQTPREMFDELSNCSHFENDYYILIPPQHEIHN